MNKTLAITQVLVAAIWPLTIFLILYLYRNKLPQLLKQVLGRVTKLGIGSISIEIAKAKAFMPDTSFMDLRNQLTAAYFSDSMTPTLLNHLEDNSKAEFAVLDLGSGKEWICSRVFILAILFERMKGIKCLVFTETSGNVGRHFVGMASPAKVRWALAKRYSWLEEAFANAYYNKFPPNSDLRIISNDGRLGSTTVNPYGPGPASQILKQFLQLIQLPSVPEGQEREWILIDKGQNINEHARWVTRDNLEKKLGSDLLHANIRSSELRLKTKETQIKLILSYDGDYVAVTEDDGSFKYLINRRTILESVAEGLVSEGE